MQMSNAIGIGISQIFNNINNTWWVVITNDYVDDFSDTYVDEFANIYTDN